VSQDGGLFICGSSLHGKLGIDNLKNLKLSKFQLVPTLSNRRVSQVACGDYHTICLLDDSSVYMWGGSLHKDKKERGKNNEMNSHSVNLPQPISALYGLEIEHIGCGDFHSVALDSNGHLYSWGGGTSASYNKG
jgi:hypothetical protein